jgi:hypothetical protein
MPMPFVLTGGGILGPSMAHHHEQGSCLRLRVAINAEKLDDSDRRILPARGANWVAESAFGFPFKLRLGNEFRRLCM